MFVTMLNSIAALFLCMGVGYVIRKVGIIDDRITSGLSKILMTVAVPCTAFMSLQKDFSPQLLVESMITLGVTVVFYLFCAMLGIALAHLFRAKQDEVGVWRFALTFPNVGYAGIPIMLAVYGQAGLLYTSMVNAAFNILVFSLGFSMFTQSKKSEKPVITKILFNPAMIGTELGFVFFVFSLKLPLLLQNATSQLSNLTTPLSMLIVGSLLAKNDLKKVFTDKKVYAITAFRLVILPLALFFLLKPFISNEMMLGVIVLLAAMPAASLTVIMAEEYRGNTELASKTVFISTLMSMVTIPCVSLLLS